MKKYEFENINQFKEFAEMLSKDLAEHQLLDCALEVAEYKKNCFGSTSEYCGEFGIVLREIINKHSKALDKSILTNIERAVQVINTMFS